MEATISSKPLGASEIQPLTAIRMLRNRHGARVDPRRRGVDVRSRIAVNRIAVLIFAPVLVLTGVLGFALPARANLVSGAPAYNTFHIVFGVIGLLVVLTRNVSLMRLFNIGFGLIDIYQALASVGHLFPQRLFRWTRTDDVLHVVIGASLIVVGVWGQRDRPRRREHE